ncbi:geminin isoform X2 [Orussus abietinus]|uniref:geminin isoform X2 n=1 Tax=Orussus abietinus TaxID=222816 RepID=UPI0006261C2E|nr:geminin isoform X2 [Orussus abietinus]
MAYIFYRDTTIVDDTKVRKSLHLLQPAATDKENLVGAGRHPKSMTSAKEAAKDEMSDKTEKSRNEKPKNAKSRNEVSKSNKKVNYKDKGVQTARGEKIKIEVEDLTSEAGPSEHYWEVLAERRRIALDDALEENRELAERVAQLEEENRICKGMLDETRALVEVLQEMIGDDNNDINNSLDDSVL